MWYVLGLVGIVTVSQAFDLPSSRISARTGEYLLLGLFVGGLFAVVGWGAFCVGLVRGVFEDKRVRISVVLAMAILLLTVTMAVPTISPFFFLGCAWITAALTVVRLVSRRWVDTPEPSTGNASGIGRLMLATAGIAIQIGAARALAGTTENAVVAVFISFALMALMLSTFLTLLVRRRWIVIAVMVSVGGIGFLLIALTSNLLDQNSEAVLGLVVGILLSAMFHTVLFTLSLRADGFRWDRARESESNANWDTICDTNLGSPLLGEARKG